MADKRIKDHVEPIPEALLEGKSEKERNEISRGYRAFTRLKSQEQSLATQAYLKCAPLEQRIPKPHRRVPFRDPYAKVKIVVPKVLLQMKSGDTSNILAGSSSHKGRRSPLNVGRSTLKVDKTAVLSTIEVRPGYFVKNMSPSERVALLYTPTCNVRTTGRNDQMRSYEYQISFRNVEIPPPPPPDIKPENAGVPGKDPSLSHFLPLEEFDNAELEIMSPEEWVEVGQESGGTPARSRFYSEDGGEEIWAPCRVVSFDRDADTFRIVWNHNNKSKLVKRLNIIFDEEDESIWRERVAGALSLRQASEADMRLHLYIEGMDNKLVTPINEDQVDKILSLVASEFPLQHLHVVERSLTEMRSMYSFGLKRAVHEYLYKNPEEQERLKNLSFPPVLPQATPSLDMLLGTIDTPSPNFQTSRTYIGENLFVAHALLFPTVHSIHARWHQFQDHLLCDTQMKGVILPCELQAFQEIQCHAGSHVSDRLRDDWSSSVHTTISNDLDTHFNFYEESLERYKQSRVYRFFRMINVVMTSQLRQLLVASITNYTSFLQKYKVVLPLDFHTESDQISELPEDTMEREYWERQAAAVRARRAKEKQILAAAQAVADQAAAAHRKRQKKSVEDAPEAEKVEDEEPSPEEERPDLEFEFFVNPTPYSRRIIAMTRETNGNEPLFVVRLISNGDAVMYSPLLEEVEDKVKGVFDNFFTYTDNIKGVGDMLFPLLQLPPFILKPLEHHEAVVMEAKEAIHRVLSENMEGPRQLQQMYQSFEYILKIDIDALVDSFATRTPPATQDDYDKTLERLFRDMERIRSRTLNEVKFELLKVECDGIKSALLRKAQDVCMSLLELLASQLNEETIRTVGRYEKIFNKICVEPKTPEELQELKRYIDGVGVEMNELDNVIRNLGAGNSLLVKYRYMTEEDEFKMFWHAFEWPKKISEVLDDSEFKYKEYRNAFQLELRENGQKLTEDIQALSGQVDRLSSCDDETRAEEYYEKARLIDANIKKYQEDIRLYNSREALFQMPTSQWSHIRDIKATFDPYLILWEVTSQYNTYSDDWLTRKFETLNAEEVDQFMNDWNRKLNIVSKRLKEEGPLEVCHKVKGYVTTFFENVPLIKALRNNLQPIHWKKIAGLVNQAIEPSTVTLNEILQKGLKEHLAKIEEISDLAAKTNMLETKLTTMESEWKKTTFEIEPYLEGYYKLKSCDAIQQMLDEHIMKTQSIMGSPYIRQAGAVEVKARNWEAQLNNISIILEEWFKCQTTWAYLEPIFSSSDIAKSLPNEAAKFQQINDSWQHIMQTTLQTPQVLNRCQDEKLKSTLIENNTMLDEILKRLHQFLETKRMAFPRFYFISNEELLQILSDSKDPFLVQPYLSKCFEGIKRIHFKDTQDIDWMESAEGEVVPFCRMVNPRDHNNAVECWLLAVEEVMCDSIKEQLKKATVDYRSRKRVEFVRYWPGQIVLAICSLFWTLDAENAMNNAGIPGLQKFFEQCRSQLEDLVVLVRDRTLNAVERCTLEALVVIEVHSKDIINELIVKGVELTTAFDWLAQLRYYWEENQKRKDLTVKQINAVLTYGYEYLGNTGRLVITPLTDRCYRTLMGALHLHYGGAPEGPAGTGKTETVKDLGKALAKQCVVYNCSDQITYKDMAKLFKGLAQSGAWSCFDEFNRIEIQVLSVIAQQVATIQEAIAQKRVEFLFDGVVIKLKMGCAVFVTMNPGYAGRTELPDNLKALFRPVAMMVPNYAMIGEIQLYSYGFLNGKSLAEKIVATYRLCSEQLSSQDHYDYGMRAVKTVLTAAGRLKRKYPDEDEGILMLRSIQDVNLPKFLAQDVELFRGIVSDLFPGVVLPKPDYDAMHSALSEIGTSMNLQLTDYFLVKCCETYEMILVRHGMMLVGYSFGGKTKVLQCLSKALGLLHQQKLEEKTRLITINPKAITMAQLYGKMDVSGDWTDGVLAKAFRTAAADTMPDRKWLVLDGPVDSLWIESMNTVLDDNKKLCLQNGDIVPMSAQMNLIFEVQDLLCASPATVSRCGMVYVEPTTLGWRCLVDSFYNELPQLIKESEVYMQILQNFFDWIVEPSLEFVRKSTAPAIPQGASVAIASLLKLFATFLKEFDFTDTKPREIEEKEVVAKMEGSFVFSVVWSIGGCLNQKDRISFNTFLCETIQHGYKRNQAYRLSFQIPERRSLYEVKFEYVQDPHFVDWIDGTQQLEVTDSTEYHEIIVPTTDTERYSFLMELFVSESLPCLLVGDTGTGKTIMARSLLTQKLDKDAYVVNLIQFSAQTTANQTQELIDGRCERRRKGVYGPPINKQMVIFVDDLNMPAVEEWGAQPPIELIRQWMDHHGWYNHTKDNVDFREVTDILFLGAMGPPGGGRNHVTPRLTRHFNTISIPSFDDQTLKKIFGSLMDWIISAKGFSGSFKGIGAQLVNATVEVYQTLVDKLKPTPEKSHYTYNLRDVAKVFQGISMAAPGRITDPTKLYRLWVHEIFRALADRLVEQSDTNWFIKVLDEVMHHQLKVGYKGIVPEEGPLLFTDFTTDARLYEEVDDLAQARRSLEDHLEYYNAVTRSGQMNLVIFNYVIEHVSRISRILKQPFGNALLIGVGGSGRTSCTKLAAKIQEYDFFTVNMTKDYKHVDFLEDVKRVLLKCGKDGIPTAFTLTDTQITEESFLEDICSLLNTGEIPGLMGEETERIQADLKNVAREMGRDGSRDTLLALFVERTRIYLHIVLCFSPVGKSLRERLRKFPSLVNCTTIDWFRDWPQEGLQNVAARFLSEVDLTEELRETVGGCFVQFQTDVRQLGEIFSVEQLHRTYVTPTSYLELLSTFKLLLGKKRSELSQGKLRYDAGCEQLQKTEDEVAIMSQELERMKPQLKRKAKETEEQQAQIALESEEAEKIRAKVAVEEEAANKKAAIAKEIKERCDAKVAEAQPKLDEAREAARTLDMNELRELKTLKEPPAKVKFVLEAVCNLLGGQYKPPPKRDPQTGKVFYPYWEHARSNVMTDRFKEILLAFDVDAATEQQINDVQTYIKHRDFDPKTIQSTSKACVGIVRYVIATEQYYQLNKVVKPLKAEQAEAENEYSSAMAELKQKMDELAVVDADLNRKKEALERKQKEKQDLENKVRDTDIKLRRALKLIEGLGGEKTRYTAEAERLKSELSHLLGDVVLSSGFVAYLGVFLNKYRQDLVSRWVQMCKDRNIPVASPFALEKFLGDPIRIQNWKLNKLPADSFSVDNALIMSNTQRWPLFIDPQQQALQWIRKMEADSKLMVIRATEKDFKVNLAAAIRAGTPVLLENVEEDLDPVLDNLLLKRIIREGAGYTVVLDEPVEYSPNFRFYITTKLPRPHYRPEVSTKVALINFRITLPGLEDQLLQDVVMSEKREVEEKKRILTIEAAQNKATLKKTEDTILALLSAEGNILENVAAIEELDRSKAQSDKIALRQQDIEVTEKQSDKARAQFVPVAHLAALLFFCVTELANIDPMYQYSLQFYIALFNQALGEAAQSEDVQERIQNITSTFQRSLYVNICRSLFTKDQLLFSFTMCLKIFNADPLETRWLLMSGFDQDKGLTPNPCKAWLPDLNWKYIWRASTQLPSFAKLKNHIEENSAALQEFYASPDPLSIPLPGDLGTYTDIRKLILIRCLRNDKIVGAVTRYVEGKLGRDYVEAPLFNLEEVCAELETAPAVPVIFVLSPGADPKAEFERVAEIKGMSGKRLQKLSLGQGQDKPAKLLIDEMRRTGGWLLLQNCHLFADFMPALARIVEDYTRSKEPPHQDYRLWLTSMPSDVFPISILQNGVKLVQEPPKGLRSNLLRSYTSDPIADSKFFTACNKPDAWQKLLFGLCFFHSLVQERRKFGPLGWNIPYEFNDTDMRISVRQLQMFINENADVPFEAITYLTGNCNYGGRVTDDWDRRCLLDLLAMFYTPAILDDEYHFCDASPIYHIPARPDFNNCLEYIKQLPHQPTPGVFGLHANADITKDEREARLLMEATLSTQPREAGSDSNVLDPKTIVLKTAHDVASLLPANYDVEAVVSKYPIRYDNSMNTVLLQELIRYNRLLTVVRRSLIELQKAIKGEVVMSADLEQVFNAICDGHIPKLWKGRSYPSLKPFGAYVQDLLARLAFLQKWIDEGAPSVYWVSGFYFTQSFFTGVMQNYARRYKIEIDTIRWNFTVMHENNYENPPENGCYISGLFLEGAGWDHGRKQIAESKPKVLFLQFPIIYVQPVRFEDLSTDPHYQCPTYKTTDRRGVLSTTGHSTNFVMVINLPRDPMVPESHWVKRGAALFTQLDY